MWKTVYLFGYKVVVKVYEQGSIHGIKEVPRISKMSVSRKGKELLNYDRGWDFNDLPEHTYKIIIKLLDIVL